MKNYNSMQTMQHVLCGLENIEPQKLGRYYFRLDKYVCPLGSLATRHGISEDQISTLKNDDEDLSTTFAGILSQYDMATLDKIAALNDNHTLGMNPNRHHNFMVRSLMDVILNKGDWSVLKLTKGKNCDATCPCNKKNEVVSDDNYIFPKNSHYVWNKEIKPLAPKMRISFGNHGFFNF